MKFLLTVKDELHLISIKNAVVMINREPQKKSLTTSERTNKNDDDNAFLSYVIILIKTFSYFPSCNYYSVNMWDTLYR